MQSYFKKFRKHITILKKTTVKLIYTFTTQWEPLWTLQCPSSVVRILIQPHADPNGQCYKQGRCLDVIFISYNSLAGGIQGYIVCHSERSSESPNFYLLALPSITWRGQDGYYHKHISGRAGEEEVIILKHTQIIFHDKGTSSKGNCFLRALSDLGKGQLDKSSPS